MTLLEVTDKKTGKLFHKLPHLIYKGDPNWACPLEGMVDDAFNPQKNRYLKDGEIIRWVLVDDNKNPIGRIAAFYNRKKSGMYEQPTGGCGFFECINSKEAAFRLFDAACDWLKTKGMEAMDGPVNPGENHMNWGLLAEGFMPQGYGMPYNPPYYVSLFEDYGFGIYFKQFSYHLDYKNFPERFWKIAKWIAQKPQFRFEHFRFANREKYIRDFASVYDEAWSSHEHHDSLDLEELRAFINGAKMVLEEKYIWFAYHEDKPIALFVMVPDINQVLRKIDGKLNLINILKMLYHLKAKTITRTRILIMGIVPKFQRSGIESGLFWHQNEALKNRPWIEEVEMSWAGDFNPKIVSVYQSVGGKQQKTHYTMRYLFDRTKPFKRSPIIGEDAKQNSDEKSNEKKKE